MRAWTIPALAVVLVLAAARVRAGESCGTCHPDVRAAYEQSVHAAGFGCTACHGGDASTVSQAAHDKERGYVGKPSRKDIPQLCASCHADPGRMHASNLPTDQYAQYQTSRHGVLLAQGDERVAVCTDCHSTHRIVNHGEPTSPIAARNIPATCGRCHADAQLMGSYGLAADQVEKFRQSVHGKALFVDEHPAAPTCATCHGAHGTTPPQIGTIAQVCGHCHARIREYLEQGPHRKAVAEGKMSECVSCHGYHDTARPDDGLFGGACQSCHAPDSAAFSTVGKLRTLLTQAREALATASDEIDAAARVSPTVVRYRPRLQQGRALFLEALPVQHSLDVDRVADLIRGARSISDEVRGSVHEVGQERRLRYLLLAVAWAFLLFAVGVIRLYRKETRRDRPSDAASPGA